MFSRRHLFAIASAALTTAIAKTAPATVGSIVDPFTGKTMPVPRPYLLIYDKKMGKWRPRKVPPSFKVVGEQLTAAGLYANIAPGVPFAEPPTCNPAALQEILDEYARRTRV
mgnify:FL=1